MSDFYIIVFFTSAVQGRLFGIHIGEYAPLVKEGNRKNKHLLNNGNLLNGKALWVDRNATKNRFNLR